MTNIEAGSDPHRTERPLRDAMEAGEFEGGEADALRIILDAFGDGTMLVEGHEDAADQVVVELE